MNLLKYRNSRNQKFVRAAGGTVWQDDSLLEWDPNDFRIFCGDLGNDVTDEVLARVFGKFPSFQKAKVIKTRIIKSELVDTPQAQTTETVMASQTKSV